MYAHYLIKEGNTNKAIEVLDPLARGEDGIGRSRMGLMRLEMIAVKAKDDALWNRIQKYARDLIDRFDEEKVLSGDKKWLIELSKKPKPF